MTFPGPKCSLCCTIFSAWGVISLLVMGILFEAGYEKLDNGDLTHKQRAEAGKTSFIVAGIYGAFVAGCLIRFLVLRGKNKNKEQFTFDSDQ